MDMQAALRARVMAATTAIVAGRVYWVDRPQGATLPSITLQTVSGDRPWTYDGLQEFRDSRVQLDVWAVTYAQARTITEALVTALSPPNISNGINFDHINFENEVDQLERLETQNIYRTRMDLLVWHKPV